MNNISRKFLKTELKNKFYDCIIKQINILLRRKIPQ